MTTVAGPQIDYRVTVDTSGGNASIAALERRTDSLGARMGRAVGGTVNLTGALQKGQPVVEKFATATSGVASALGGVGSRAGQSLGAVSNLAAMMMTTGPFGIALVAATTGIAAVVNHLDKMEQKAVDAGNALRRQAVFGLKEYEDEVRGIREALDDVGKSDIQKRIEEHEATFQTSSVAVDEYRKELDHLNRQLDQRLAYQRGGISAYDDEIERLQKRKGELDANLSREERNVELSLEAIEGLHKLREAEERLTRVKEWRARVEKDAHERSLRVLEARRAELALEQQITKDREARRTRRGALETDLDERVRQVEANLKAVDDVEVAHQRAAERRAEAHQRALADLRLKSVDDYQGALSAAVAAQAEAERRLQEALAAARDAATSGLGNVERLAEAQRVVDERVRLEEEAAARVVQLTEQLERKRIELAEKTAEERQRLEEQNQAVIVESTNAIAGSLLSSSMMLMEGIITGQEKAFERALAAFLTSTGQQIAAIGLRAVIEGGLISLNPLTPGAGAPMVAGGFAAIGIGMSMAGGGIALGHVASGGQLGRALPGSGGGAGGGSSAGGGLSTRETVQEAGGGRVENHYHFHGPTFDYNGSARAVRELYDHEQSELLGGGRRR